MRRAMWPYWVVGIIFGAVVGVPVASFGMPALVLGIGSVALAFLSVRSLALLSGAVTGIGGIWLAILARAQLACDAFDAAPNQGCESSGVEPWVLLSVVVVGIGLVLGGVAWRREREAGGSVSRRRPRSPRRP